ncbi:MAG TPA: membrane protein insertase YidC, partial [Bacteroidia bacterium]|nr:membrane protein insertase YidC [Bacteroidia bacterium]
MMDKRSIIGFVLLAALLTFWMSWNSKNSEKEQAAKKRSEDSIAKIEQEKQPVTEKNAVISSDTSLNKVLRDTLKFVNRDSLREVMGKASYGAFAGAAKGEDKPVILENEKIKLWIFPRGGRVGQVEIKGVKRYAPKGEVKQPLLLFTPDSTRFGLEFFDRDRRRFNSDSLFFTPESSNVSVKGNDSGSVRMRLYTDTSRAAYIEYLYTLRGNSFMAGVNITFSGCQSLFADDQGAIDLVWSMKTPQQEKTVENERAVSTVVFLFDGEEDVESLSETDDESKKLNGQVKWVSFKQQYFSSVLIANDHFANNAEGTVRVPSDPFSVKAMHAVVPVPFGGSEKETFPIRAYFGPNEYSELKSHGIFLDRQLSLGASIFGTLNRYVFIPLFSWLGDMFPFNYGLVILLLTVIVKIVLYPIAYKSF